MPEARRPTFARALGAGVFRTSAYKAVGLTRAQYDQFVQASTPSIPLGRAGTVEDEGHAATATPLGSVKCAIRNQLKVADIPWLRFHAFRRGVATNLHDAGVNDLTIQRVLRHSDVNVTRRSYIKRLPAHAVGAMSLFQAQVEKVQKETRQPAQ